jgi:NADH/NAD ratio-sensing transcriptional regulator Rex
MFCNFRSSGKNRACSNTVATLLNIVGVRVGADFSFWDTLCRKVVGKYIKIFRRLVPYN